MEPWDALFGKFPRHVVEEALEHFEDMAVAAGDTLMREGDDDPTLIYILEGGVSIRKGGRELDTSGPGEVIGEMALFRSAPRVAHVITNAPTRALVLDREGYEALINLGNVAAFQLERLVLADLAARLRRLDDLVARRAEGQENPYLPPPKGFFKMLAQLVAPGGPPAIEKKEFDPVAALEASHLFHGERWTFVNGLAPYFEHRVWAPGELLCTQGESGEELHVIVSGRADVLVNVPGPKRAPKVHRLGRVGPGDAVGMTSLMDGRPRMANVVAAEQVDALALSRERFWEIVGKNGQFSSALRRAMIRAFAEQVEEAGANLVAVTPGDHDAVLGTGWDLEVCRKQ
ncbi:MAG: cyclic nucleotide-binding domain-containing protein [Deltaproteobacteria bacterium]|nr:cyclic nucleotide-binding domain-containing protein [Deltaproteobacteria bacterium]